jgi:transketolase
MSQSALAHAKAIQLAEHVLTMTTTAGSGHPSSALALVHLVVELMYRQMRYDPTQPTHPASDRLVLSEGHAVPIIYAAWADLGGYVGGDHQSARALTVQDLADLRELTSPLDGHPNPAEGFPFFDAATGSLGQGLSVAAGLALAARLRGIGKRIFCLIGDGEAREGQVWEALDFIVDHHLTHVLPIFNCNGQGQADYVSQQQSPERLAAKLAAFGYEVVQIDGHDPAAIAEALAAPTPLRLRAILARTIKGWGVPCLYDKSNHGKPVSKDDLPQALDGLKQAQARLEVTAAPTDWKPAAPLPTQSQLPTGTIETIGFEEALQQVGLASALEKQTLPTRNAYGAALVALGQADQRIVALDGDVKNSTFSEYFAERFGDRFFECKIAEQNMIGTAAGLAAGGFIPFVSSFAKFLARAYDQVEMANITRANVKLVGSHAGASLGADGPSQMGLLDVTYFRGFTRTDTGRDRPALYFFHPADAVAAFHLTVLMANLEGMCYMRTHRPSVPILYPYDAHFEPGGHKVLRHGDSVCLVASGYMVHEALKAADLLTNHGHKATVIDAYSFPMDRDMVLEAADRVGGLILTIEDNYCGGLHAAIAEAAAAAGENIRVHGMTCARIPKSARTADEMLTYLHLSPKHIAERAEALIESA